MPEVDQFTFTNKELLELLIKAAGVHDGKWILQATFNFSAGNFGPNPAEMAPGVVAAVGKMGITRAQKDSPDGMAVDASIVNPRAAASVKRPPSARSRSAGS